MAWGARKRMLEIGAPAPSVSLSDLNGQPRALADLVAEGPVVLAFFKITCPVCQFTLPFLERIHQQGSAIRIFAVSQDDARATTRFLRDYGISFPALLDEEGSYPASNGFGISQVPTLFLVGQEGAIQWVSSGFSRRDLETLGQRAGATVFRQDEYVPDHQPG